MYFLFHNVSIHYEDHSFFSMKRFLLFFSVVCASITSLFFAIQDTSAASQEPRRILVQYTETQSTANGSVLSKFGEVRLKKGESMKTRLKELHEDPSVLRAAPNYVREIVEVVPNDPLMSDQYHIDQTDAASIDVQKAWSVTKGKKSVVIAVIDTGVDLDHPDLKSKIWENTAEVSDNGVDDDGNGFVDDVNGWDFFEENNNPSGKPCSEEDTSGVIHGTHVAGIAAGITNNGVGVSGIGWNTKIMALKVASCDGTMTDSDIAPAIEYAVANGAKVINMSLGGIGSSSVIDSVIQEAIAKGVTVVAASGNYGRNLNRIPAFPVCSSGVIGVAATDQNNQIASFSNFGDKCVDVSAPGVDILSTLYHDPSVAGYESEYGYLSGTSMATPVVSGIVSLLIAQEGDLTPAEILSIIESSSENIGASTSYGSGKVNAVKALLALDSVKPVHITAWTNSKKKKQHPANTRRKDPTPYFKWVVPELLNSQIAGYYRYFGKSSDADAVIDGTFTTKKSFSPSELSNGNEKKYYLKIAIKLTDGTIYSDRGSFTYLHDNVINGEPTITSLKKSGSDAVLEWKKISDEHVQNYEIRRKLNSEEDFKTIGKVNESTTTYTDTSTETGKKYVYKIRALDNLENKSVSETKSITF